MKKGVVIFMMTCAFEKGFNQTIAHMEPRMLSYERKLTDALMGNALIAQAAYAENALLGLHLENMYSIQQSNAVSFAMIVPLKNNVISAAMGTEGISSFRNLTLNIGDAMQLQKNLSIGLKFLSTGTQIKNNKSLISIGYQLGMSYTLSDATHCHLHFSNNRPINSSYNDNIQGVYQIQVGAAQYINNGLIISCDIDQTKGRPISITPGMAWSIQKEIQLLVGVKPLPGEVFIGIGWKKDRSRMILCISHHSYLGNSFSIRYNLEKK